MLSLWFRDNNLDLNVSKTQEMIIDFRREKQRNCATSLSIYGMPVERICNYKYLRDHISENLTWITNISTMVKKARQCLYNLRGLRKFKNSTALQRVFYTSATESVLPGSITAWYGNCTALDRKALNVVIQSAERTTRLVTPTLRDFYTRRCTTRARQIIKDIHLLLLLTSSAYLLCYVMLF